jgi:hypothetical protein
LVEDCAAVGGANDRSEMGTSLHTITALYDLGRSPSHLSEEVAEDLETYVLGLSDSGITFLPGAVELTVVLDEWKVAGMVDRFAVVPGYQTALTADLKTGTNLDYSWQAFAVQMAAYSRANNIYRQGPAADGSQDVRLPMPEVDQHHGLIMWLDAGKRKMEFHIVDLDAGWEGFEHSMWARGWRTRKLSVPFDPQVNPFAPSEPDDLVPALEASVQAAATPLTVVPDPKPQPPKPQPVVTTDYQPLRDWLQGRIDVIGAHSPQARTELSQRWPVGVPTLRANPDHTVAQLGAIEEVLDAVERSLQIPFPPPRPGQVTVARLLQLFPNSEEV